MVFAVIANLYWSGGQATRDRDRALAICDQGFSPNGVWGDNRLDNQPARITGNPGVLCLRRYFAQADAQDLYDRLVAHCDANLPVQSTIQLHSCSHDEGTNACVVLAERSWA